MVQQARRTAFLDSSQPEEERLAEAQAAMPEVLDVFRQRVEDFRRALGRAGNVEAGQRIAREHGHRLWRAAVERAQDENNPDDRPLYWTRLRLARTLRRWQPGFELSDEDRLALLASLEATSRGWMAARFERTDARRILLSGFDPYLLALNLRNSNPSGAAALALDGALIAGGGVPAEIRAVVFPVRYDDFDAGVVENFFRPYFQAGRVDMVVTLSMGRTDFDVERFPGRRRSSTMPDNAGRQSGGRPDAPAIPRLGEAALEGPEFLEMNLPLAEMQAVAGPFTVNDHRQVRTLRGEAQVWSLADLAGETAVAGSGGGFLSNEISYRTLLLRNQTGARIAVGHIHTPFTEGEEPDKRKRIIEQIRRMLIAAVPAL